MRRLILRLSLLICVSFMVIGKEIRPGIPNTNTVYRLLCFGGPGFKNSQRYNPTKEDCVNGTVVPLFIESSSSSTTISSTSTFHTSPVNTRTSIQPSPKIETCLMPEDVSEKQCYAQTLCGGFECCGTNKAYNPQTSTCCSQLGKGAIFRDKKEKDHICCYNDGKITVHKRGTQPCVDPSSNDKLWKKNIKLKDMDTRLDCGFKVAYLVKDLNTSSQSDSEFHGTITLQEVYPSYLNQSVFEKRVNFDKYSPIKPVKENSLLVLTAVDQSAPNRFQFFTYSNDQVYRIPFCSRRSKKLHNYIKRKVSKRKCSETEKSRQRKHGKKDRAQSRAYEEPPPR